MATTTSPVTEDPNVSAAWQPSNQPGTMTQYYDPINAGYYTAPAPAYSTWNPNPLNPVGTVYGSPHTYLYVDKILQMLPTYADIKGQIDAWQEAQKARIARGQLPQPLPPTLSDKWDYVQSQLREWGFLQSDFSLNKSALTENPQLKTAWNTLFPPAPSGSNGDPLEWNAPVPGTEEYNRILARHPEIANMQQPAPPPQDQAPPVQDQAPPIEPPAGPPIEPGAPPDLSVGPPGYALGQFAGPYEQLWPGQHVTPGVNWGESTLGMGLNRSVSQPASVAVPNVPAQPSVMAQPRIDIQAPIAPLTDYRARVDSRETMPPVTLTDYRTPPAENQFPRLSDTFMLRTDIPTSAGLSTGMPLQIGGGSFVPMPPKALPASRPRVLPGGTSARIGEFNFNAKALSHLPANWRPGIPTGLVGGGAYNIFGGINPR